MSKEDKQIPLQLIKSIDLQDLSKILDAMRVFLKSNQGTIDLFKEYDADINEIDYIPMRFDDIDTSAKTSKGVISFSYSLLEDADFFNDYSYAQHEITHWLQQTANDGPTKSDPDEDYLKNKHEQEGFQNQIEFIDEHQGEQAAEDYVDDLLDYHEHEGKEKSDIKKTLMKKV